MLKRPVQMMFMIIIAVLLSSQYPLAAEATMYPLQTKYPDTMLYKGSPGKKTIALTFDDGPDHRFTP